MSRGRLIVIEGTDSSGKETQTEKLYQALVHAGIKCESISFPRYHTPTGRIVGECYLGKPRDDIPGQSWFANPSELDPLVASLYYAADRREAARDIFRILNSGAHLIANRYVESNMGHQGGKIRNEQDREKLFEDLDLLEHGLLKLPRPDIVIFLHMPSEVAKKLNRERRGSLKDAHERDDEHQKNAEEAYLQLAKLRSWTTIECAPNGYPPRSIEDVACEIREITVQLLARS